MQFLDRNPTLGSAPGRGGGWRLNLGNYGLVPASAGDTDFRSPALPCKDPSGSLPGPLSLTLSIQGLRRLLSDLAFPRIPSPVPLLLCSGLAPPTWGGRDAA